ncbi:MAG: VWA domain-containing protein [Calditrichaeota bacterium]|nr:MAG: VWA domain-containing protein [Calditrichota bacterium]
MMKNITTHNGRALISRLLFFIILLMTFFFFPHEKNPLFGFQANRDLNIEFISLNTTNFPEILAELKVSYSDSTAVTDLHVSEFTLWEDRIEQPTHALNSFGGDSGGAAITMIMDISGSMDDDLPAAKVAAVNFINLLNPLDQASLISFDAYARVVHGFTFDKPTVINAINSLQIGAGTALYDALVAGLNITRPIDGKKALVVLADGHDSRSSTQLEALLATLEAEGIPVYLIGLGRTLDYKSEATMRRIAESSGGQYFRSPTTGELARIYEEIAYIISNQYYVLSYMAENCIEDGSSRTLKIEVAHNGYSGEYTHQYTAPGHYVTIKPEMEKRPHAGENFHLSLQVPPSSLPLFNMRSVNFTVSYDPTQIKIVQPAAASVLPGTLLGSAASHAFDFTVRENEGKIDISIAKLDAGAIITGKGSLAEIIFQPDSSLIDSTALHFSIENVASENRRGCEVALTIEANTEYTNGMWVWPGDTNHNGKVELSDVLRLGLFWDLRGPARSEPDLVAWKPQSANKFATTQATFADADGGGLINERDLIPIAVNWSLSRSDAARNNFPAAAKTGAAPQGTLSIEKQSADYANVAMLKLNWHNAAAQSLAGITFRMHYPVEKIDSVTARVGEKWHRQPLYISNDDKENGLFSMGIMLTDGQVFPHENGEIVEIKMHSRTDFDLSEVTFTDIAFVGAQGQMNEIGELKNESYKVQDVPQNFKLYPAYPNPFNPSTKIVYDAPDAAHVAVHIYNSVGQMLTSAEFSIESAGTFSYVWNGRDFSGRHVASGTYFIELLLMSTKGNNYRGLQKVSLVK